MITIHSYRYNGEDHDLGERSASIAEALQSLLKYELGFGGFVKGSTDDSLTTETIVFKCRDTTVFSGPSNEMTYLFYGAVAYRELTKQNLEADVQRAVVNSKGSALLLTSAGGGLPEVLINRRYSEVAAAAAITQDLNKVKILLNNFKDEDLYAALDLVLQGTAITELEVSTWKKDDGFFESVLRLRPDTSPILKLRAVISSNGYQAVIRDYNTGVMLGCKYGFDSYVNAAIASVSMAMDFIKNSLKSLYGPSVCEGFLRTTAQFMNLELMVGDSQPEEVSAIN